SFLNIRFLASNVTTLTPSLGLICLCLLLGATGKSAQIPLTIWLPDAMAGPTPVSALIHAATMVTAGVYLIARLHFLFILSPLVMTIMATIGVVTAFLAALLALTQYDIKKILAYSTISQLGLMFLALGVGAFSSALFHVFTHAFFKAGLFLGAGIIIQALHHEQDIRHMGGLLKKFPVVGIAFFLCLLSLAGIPPFAGFFSKDEILYFSYALSPYRFHYYLALITAGLTALYSMRLFARAFLGQPHSPPGTTMTATSPVMTGSLIVLTIFSTLAGFVGLPRAWGNHLLGAWLTDWETTTPHHMADAFFQEVVIIIFATLLSLSLMVLVYRLYSRNEAVMAPLKKTLGILYRFIHERFWVDELIEGALIRPLHRFTNGFIFRLVDQKIIDGLAVNGVTNTSRLFARLLALMHSGVIAHYALYLLVALGLFFVLLVLV
ncbi:MAG TPA: NADH-quinone oxidoreductase subunit L, partial [bacterium]|nr:NADH-quinone oxidoreductase subunit L [bacterium]